MRRIVLASVLMMASSAAALAQAPAAPAPPPQVDPVTTIQRIDVNQDGAASRQEWVAYGNHDAGFTAMDTDKDGRVTVAELVVFRKDHATADKPYVAAETPKLDAALTIRMADSNQDGGVSEAEWVAYGNHAGAGFAPVDGDHDGKITTAELTAYRAARAAATAAK